ncbi:MAG TPA: CAP domain-containing protein [Patescibacteria group bacterium]|nr:CAP domain-containing protein [Patescibacteria group bacterium]
MKKKQKAKLKKILWVSVKGIIVLLAFYGLVSVAQNLNDWRIKRALTTPASAVAPAPTFTPEDWLNAVNAERAKAGVVPLTLDARLNASAQQKANELSSEPDTDGNPHTNSKGVQGYTYIHQSLNCTYASENIVWNYASVPSGIEWWLGSPAHRTAMLDSQYTLTGFGTSGSFTVEHFCAI